MLLEYHFGHSHLGISHQTSNNDIRNINFNILKNNNNNYNNNNNEETTYLIKNQKDLCTASIFSKTEKNGGYQGDQSDLLQPDGQGRDLSAYPRLRRGQVSWWCLMA